MKLMNMIEHMAETPIHMFSFYEVLLLSMMIAGCILFGVTMVACFVLGFVASPWFFAAMAASLAAFCFCLTVVLFTADE
jgi:hypothetical protein